MKTPRLAKYLSVTLVAVGLACGEPDDDMSSDGSNVDNNPPANSDGGPNDDDPQPSSGACTFFFENAITDSGYDVTILYLYVSPSTSSDWGPDQLGASILRYGEVLGLDSIPAGEYDVRVVDEFDLTYSRYGVECDGDDWYWEVTLSDLD